MLLVPPAKLPVFIFLWLLEKRKKILTVISKLKRAEKLPVFSDIGKVCIKVDSFKTKN